MSKSIDPNKVIDIMAEASKEIDRLKELNTMILNRENMTAIAAREQIESLQSQLAAVTKALGNMPHADSCDGGNWSHLLKKTMECNCYKSEIDSIIKLESAQGE